MWSDCMADAYRDLIAWRKATDLALEIYRATQKFPKDELYRPSLPNATSSRIGCQQYRRRRRTLLPARNLRSSRRARGSLLELETQLFIAKELHDLEPLVFRRMEDRTKELGRILNGLINSVLEGIKVAS